MDRPLAGRTIALPEARDLDALARMLDELGAATLRCPLISILDAPDPTPVLAWLRELVDGRFDDVVLLTGEGLRRLIALAERHELRDAVVAALGKVRRITRGTKPARALTDLGLRTDLPAPAPTTAGVIAALTDQNLSGRTVGVQLYGLDPNEPLVSFLLAAGAVVRTVAPYVYAPASDDRRVLDLIDRMNAGGVDAIAFTSAPQVRRLWEVAQEHHVQPKLDAAMTKVRVAAVGPVVADELAQRGVNVGIAPAKNFFMRALVNQIAAELGEGGKTR